MPCSQTSWNLPLINHRFNHSMYVGTKKEYQKIPTQSNLWLMLKNFYAFTSKKDTFDKINRLMKIAKFHSFLTRKVHKISQMQKQSKPFKNSQIESFSLFGDPRLSYTRKEVGRISTEKANFWFMPIHRPSTAKASCSSLSRDLTQTSILAEISSPRTAPKTPQSKPWLRNAWVN